MTSFCSMLLQKKDHIYSDIKNIYRINKIQFILDLIIRFVQTLSDTLIASTLCMDRGSRLLPWKKILKKKREDGKKIEKN